LQKSRDVIPAEAGIQFFDAFWTPAFAGVTGVVKFAITSKKLPFSALSFQL